MCFWKDESPKISNLTKKEKKLMVFSAKKCHPLKIQFPQIDCPVAVCSISGSQG